MHGSTGIYSNSFVRTGLHNLTRLLRKTCFCENATYILLLGSTWQVRLSDTPSSFQRKGSKAYHFVSCNQFKGEFCHLMFLRHFSGLLMWEQQLTSDTREDCHLATCIWGKVGLFYTFKQGKCLGEHQDLSRQYVLSLEKVNIAGIYLY